MLNAVDVKGVKELVCGAAAMSGAFVESVNHFDGGSPQVQGYVEHGVDWSSGVCATVPGLKDIANYRAHIDRKYCSAWMDNTTIVTGKALMSEAGSTYMTPLTLWDLACFVRSVVFYERIYHHEHPDVDDKAMNDVLGSHVFCSLPLPIQRDLRLESAPQSWVGVSQLMCHLWSSATLWLERLRRSSGRNNLDEVQMKAVVEAWRVALGTKKIDVNDLLGDVSTRWSSPSNQLLRQVAEVSGLDEDRIWLDPTEQVAELARLKRAAGLPDNSRARRSELLSDLNLRAYINQHLAEFLSLPYESAHSRVPFRRHLYDRSRSIQEQLVTEKLIDDRYGQLAKDARLRVPVVLALSIQGIRKPEDLWTRLAELRAEATKFRAHRAELEAHLVNGDQKEASKVAKALSTSIEGLLKAAGSAVTTAGAVVIEKVAKGDLSPVGTGIAATAAVAKKTLKGSVADRLMMRLRRPELLWMNDIVDQAQHLTDALPTMARVWGIAPREQSAFVERFKCAKALSE